MENEMTLHHIKQIRDYTSRAKKLKSNPNINSICDLNNQIRAFLGESYLPFKLSSELARFYGNSRTSAEMQADLDSIIAALAGKISECSKSNEIQKILDDIEEIECIIPSGIESRFECVSRIYHSYCAIMDFDDGIKNAARYADGAGLSAGEYSEATPSMLKGLQLQLNRYAEKLCENKPLEETKTPLIQVTNNPTISATAANNISIDISIEIENAIKQVENACLPDAQEKEVLQKIQELKKIVESTESKKSKWTKIKDFFKWVAEQGIQVASIIVPLLATTIK